MEKSTDGTITLTREELYDLVWTTPIVQLAEQFSLSDRGLSKACERFDIPRPRRGYWAKKQHGKRVRRTPLPRIEGASDPDLIDIRPQPQGSRPRRPREQASEPPIIVPNELTDPHPLVARTEQSLRAARTDDTGLVTPRAKRALRVSVGPESIDRAMRITDTLLKALGERGHTARAVTNDEGEPKTTIEIDEECIDICMTEKLMREERPLTPREQREKERDPWMYDRPVYRYYPNGLLCLEVLTRGDERAIRRWSDGKKTRLERRLNSFVAALERTAEVVRMRRRERELARQRREAWEAERYEKLRLIEEEERRLEVLNAEVDGWHKGQRIRTYVEAVREAALAKHGEIEEGSKLAGWLVWATTQADRVDPLVKTPPSILDEKRKWRGY